MRLKRTLGAEAGDLKALLQDMVPVCLLSMEAVERLLSDGNSTSPEEDLLEKQTREQLQSALGALEERERLLIQYYYYEDMTLDDAAKKLRFPNLGIAATLEMCSPGSRIFWRQSASHRRM